MATELKVERTELMLSLSCQNSYETHQKNLPATPPPGWYRNTAHLLDSCLHCFTFMCVYVSVICQEFQFMPLLVSSPTLNLDIWLPWLQERAFL